jgi:hypothetical protein
VPRPGCGSLGDGVWGWVSFWLGGVSRSVRRALMMLGYRVLRLPARLVVEHPVVALSRIRAALAE